MPKVQNRNLSPEAERLLTATKESLINLRRQFRDLMVAEKSTNELIHWLECPWDYGDVVEEKARTWGPQAQARALRRLVIVSTRGHGIDGRLVKSDGTLEKDTQYINRNHRLVGQYTGNDLPEPSEAAILARKAKGGVGGPHGNPPTQ